MVRDLVETSIREVKQKKMITMEERAKRLADERIVEIMAPMPKQDTAPRNPLEMLFGNAKQTGEQDNQAEEQAARRVHFEREILS